MILKSLKNLFTQEPFWSIIYNIPSSLSKEGDKIIGALNWDTLRCSVGYPSKCWEGSIECHNLKRRQG